MTPRRRIWTLLLLAFAAFLAPRSEASRTSAWGSNPPSSLTATRADAAGLLASPAPAATADAEPTGPPLFDLGDIILVDTADADEAHFDLGPLTLVDLNLLRGPPPSYPETRVGGFELLPPFRVGASPSLSLWSRQACGFSCREVASDSRYDPWGLCVFGLPCPKAAQAAIDWAGVAVDTTVANLKGIGAEALRFGQKAADVATGGVSAGFRSAASAAATASGSSTERLGETGQAFLRGQLGSLTQGFSEADDKVGHAEDLVGIGAIDRGTKRGFEGALTGDFDAALRGGAEAMSGVGQLSGTAAAAYAPFAGTTSPGIRPATGQPMGGRGIVLADGQGATAAEMAASRSGPTAGSRVGQGQIRQQLIDDAVGRGDLRCWRCGQVTTNPRNLQVGHRNVPVSKGGSLNPANVCLEGAACNLGAGNRGAPAAGKSCAERGGCGTPFGRLD